MSFFFLFNFFHFVLPTPLTFSCGSPLIFLTLSIPLLRCATWSWTQYSHWALPVLTRAAGLSMGLTGSCHVYMWVSFLQHNIVGIRTASGPVNISSFLSCYAYSVGKLLRGHKISTVDPVTVKKLQAKLFWHERIKKWIRFLYLRQ